MASFERILLTGGGGFVGWHLAQALAAAYPNARRAVVVRPGETFAGADWTPIAANLLDERAIDKAVADTQPDLVVHLAGQASVGHAHADAEQTWRVNFHGSFSLAAALARHTPQTTVLFSSSATVYGASLREGLATEDTALKPLDSYSRSKAAVEAAFVDILGQESRLIVARPVNHSGPRQNAKNFALPSFAAQIAAIESGRKEPRLLVGDLSKARDFLDVRDVVDAYMRLIAVAPVLSSRENFFNVASGAPHTIQSLLDGLRARAARPFAEVIDQNLFRPSDTDIDSIACDASRLRETTGWRPNHSIDDMLQSLLDYWRDVERTERPGALPASVAR